jgi:hypothetical protein
VADWEADVPSYPCSYEVPWVLKVGVPASIAPDVFGDFRNFRESGGDILGSIGLRLDPGSGQITGIPRATTHHSRVPILAESRYGTCHRHAPAILTIVVMD